MSNGIMIKITDKQSDEAIRLCESWAVLEKDVSSTNWHESDTYPFWCKICIRARIVLARDACHLEESLDEVSIETFLIVGILPHLGGSIPQRHVR
jgi:hypothetical protein